MHRYKIWMAGLALLLASVEAVQAAVNEPYVADGKFGGNGTVYDPLVNLAPAAAPRAGGERLVVDADGGTVVAGLATVSFFFDWHYLVVTRYSATGQRQAWSHPSDGYTDDTHQYLVVPPIGETESLQITAVADVKIGPYGDINVLVDGLNPDTEANTRSMVVTFGPDGAYKGIVTHMATPAEDDVGVALLPWGSSMFIVSSAGTKVNMARYNLNMSNGVPALDTTWGNAGRVSQTLFLCAHYVTNIGVIQNNCTLRARRALIAETANATSIYVAGEYANDQGDGVGQSDLFIMHFSPADGAGNAAYPVVWNSATEGESLRGLAFRNKTSAPQRAQNELYLLDAFPRPCGSGFIVQRFNADTGAYINRTYTSGGGTNPDPNVCAGVTSLEATDLALSVHYDGTLGHQASRYLAVVGSAFDGEPYTGKNAFVALVDSTNMTSTPQVQEFTHNAGQAPDNAGFQAVVGNFADGSYTATGKSTNDDGDTSLALTMRVHPDRIFTNDFEWH